MPAIISEVTKKSIAEELCFEKGDKILKINGETPKDLIDYRFAINDEYIELEIERKNGEIEVYEIEKDFDEDLGIVFESAVFDRVKLCANNCVFCFVDQQPAGLRESLYVKDDDYRLLSSLPLSRCFRPAPARERHEKGKGWGFDDCLFPDEAPARGRFEKRKKHLPLSVKKPLRLTFATSNSAIYPIYQLVKALNAIENVECDLVELKNSFFGKDVIVAGLITGKDLINQLKSKKIQKLIIPSIMLRPFSADFLDGVTVFDVENELNCKVQVINDIYSVKEVFDLLKK